MKMQTSKLILQFLSFKVLEKPQITCCGGNKIHRKANWRRSFDVTMLVCCLKVNSCTDTFSCIYEFRQNRLSVSIY